MHLDPRGFKQVILRSFQKLMLLKISRFTSVKVEILSKSSSVTSVSFLENMLAGKVQKLQRLKSKTLVFVQTRSL